METSDAAVGHLLALKGLTREYPNKPGDVLNANADVKSPRQMHPAFYDPLLMKPSRIGIDYLMPIFTDAIGNDDAEHMRQTLFDPGNLAQPYHSINTDVHKRIRYLEANGRDSED